MRATMLLTLLLSGCVRGPVVPGRLAVVRDATPLLATVHDDAFPTAGPRPAQPRPPPHRRASPYGDRLAASAQALIDGSYPSGFRDDCSGFVCAASSSVGDSLPSSTAALWDLARRTGAVHHRKEPRVGDLAFFDDTWDRNRNGRLDDPLTHVGIVVAVHPNGTADIAHVSSSRGRTLLRVNLHQPDVHEDAEHRRLNDWLRVRGKRDPRGTRYLAGELWRAWATLDLDASGGR